MAVKLSERNQKRIVSLLINIRKYSTCVIVNKNTITHIIMYGSTEYVEIDTGKCLSHSIYYTLSSNNC